MEHGRARLDDLRGRPWETVLVREDGFEDLDGSITLERKGEDFRLTNHLKRPLLAVIAMTAKGDLVSFGRIAPGASVLGSAGSVVTSIPPPVAAVAAVATAPGLVSPRALSAYQFSERANALSKGAGDAWEALESAGVDNTDWWPEAVPVALAEIEGGSGTRTDSELRVDRDRKLVRIVGEASP
jgi:hypothetical protein